MGVVRLGGMREKRERVEGEGRGWDDSLFVDVGVVLYQFAWLFPLSH